MICCWRFANDYCYFGSTTHPIIEFCFFGAVCVASRFFDYLTRIPLQLQNFIGLPCSWKQLFGPRVCWEGILCHGKLAAYSSNISTHHQHFLWTPLWWLVKLCAYDRYFGSLVSCGRPFIPVHHIVIRNVYVCSSYYDDHMASQCSAALVLTEPDRHTKDNTFRCLLRRIGGFHFGGVATSYF